jgi:acyl-CoA synthetase (AMP-forming)/AMP-acid ligase II
MVRDAVALGVDDDRLGQHIVVIVAGSSEDPPVDAEALVKDLRKRLPLYMVPKRVVVRNELPRSPNGKFDRNLLRQELVT